MPQLPGVLRRTPLRVTLVAVLLLLVALALTATGAVATTVLRSYLLDRVDARLLSTAVPVVERIERGDPRLLGRETDALELPTPVRIEVLDARGARLVRLGTSLPGEGSGPDLPGLDAAAVTAQAGEPFTVGSVDGGEPWRAAALPVLEGQASVVVATSLAEVGRTTRRLVVVQVLVGLAALGALGVLGTALVRLGLRPLAEVERTAQAIAAGDLSRRVPGHDPRTEVGRLGAALNGMLSQVEAAFAARSSSEAAARSSEERMRRFVADASHELRTPLTSIRGFAELFRQGAVHGPEEVSRVFGRVESEAARMGSLVEDLLLLARLDREPVPHPAPVDLLVLAGDAVQDARAVDPDRPVRLEVLPGPPPVTVGDEARLRQVFANLVSNALVHTPAGTPVRVRVGAGEPGRVVLEVADDGPGLAAEHAERVFERFYRVEDSRSRSSGGSGLGLSIVASIVAAHGGDVEVRTRPGAGACFRVRLPAAAPSDALPAPAYTA